MGSIKNAGEYFASIGLTNEENINPSDYFLELAQKPPPGADSSTTFRDLFSRSEHHARFAQELSDAVSSRARRPAAALPSACARLGIMLAHFARYFAKERGFYVYRAGSLAAIGVFMGTLFFGLRPESQYIGKYCGSMFFSGCNT
jgi:hypothetical protein